MKQVIRKPIPAGTRVRVEQRVVQRDEEWLTTVEGQVMSHDMEPTGSWYAHGYKDRLWLPRLRLRKDDGEVTTLNLDDHTRVLILADGNSK